MRHDGRLAVLHVCSASQAIYGAVQSLLTLARTQREVGHRIEFLTFAGKRFGAQVRQEGFPVSEVRVRFKIDPVAILAMRRTIRTGGFDLVHTHLSTSSVNGCLAARLARVPCIATVHGMSGKMSFAAANHLISVSGEVKKHLVAQGVPADRISVVHNGLGQGFQVANRSEIRASLGIADPDPVIGTVSRVTALKGIEDAIRATDILRRRFPNIRYVVVGDGDGLEPCRALAGELGLNENTKFLGYQTDIARVLSSMDVFVFPSHKEAMGIALVEAMAAGLPCVATNVGGIPEVVTNETGILVPAGDPAALAAATADLLADEMRRTSMANAARERVKSCFSAEAMERETEAVYRRLLDQDLSVRRSSTPVTPTGA